MKRFLTFILRGCRYVYRRTGLPGGTAVPLYEERVELSGQQANDYLRELLSAGGPCMVSKFGMTEMSVLANYRLSRERNLPFRTILEYVQGKRTALGLNYNLNHLCALSGFFPNDLSLLPRFYNINIEAMKAIDVLGSYMFEEDMFEEELSSCRRVNLDGYYAPFYWERPWTAVLKGKKVLVIHPFAEEIRHQYGRRELLWKDPDVLPEFQLITYKAVQSILDTQTEFPTWFDALDKMKSDISRLDFDIALIGCGAYGMPLAAHVKSMGKQAVHLAGWTQILFGIIGKRWEDNPRTASYINEYWIRPFRENRPDHADQVEKGCYW